ncbi:hypothetical protein [Vulgatibacter sp.]|uniref:hypothetical protein n=1 Tax=Vulgatibacter sp. TaxID=1971226 RepID=UPI003563E7CA
MKRSLLHALQALSFALLVAATGAVARPALAEAEPLAFATTELPVGVVGLPWEARIETVGGTGPVTLEFPPGEMPVGIHVDGDTLRGTPMEADSFSFVLVARSGEERVAAVFAVRFVDAGTCLTSRLPNAVVGRHYASQVEIAGGALPWTFDAGDLVLGLQVSSSGEISGIPIGETAEPLTLEVRARDREGLESSCTLELLVIAEADLFIEGSGGAGASGGSAGGESNGGSGGSALTGEGGDDDGGCAASATGPSLLAAGLVLARLRRRS